jgi:ubiquinone/menaquinone biosynthesis C-methylase UbiE
MATPFDRAAKRYLEEWVPRFVPYHLDLVRELALAQGQRVLVARCGPGAEVIAVARAVGDRGRVRATDPSGELISICEGQVKNAGFPAVTCERAAPSDVGEGGWNAVICAFGLWTLEDRPNVLKRWGDSLAPHGKVGVLSFGPPDETDPFEILGTALRELEPDAVNMPPRIESTRDRFERVFEEGGLSLVRHTILRHTVSFATAEAFTDAIREGRTWRNVWEELGPDRMRQVTARFYDRVGGPTAPLVFEPAATLAIGAIPGDEVELSVRPSVIAKKLTSSPPPSNEASVEIPKSRQEPWDHEKPKG